MIFLLSLIALSSFPMMVFAQEPTIMTAGPGEDLEDYYYLIDERLEQSYEEGDVPAYDVGVWLTRIGKIDREVGSVELDFYLFVNVREENNPIDFTKEKPQIDFVNGRKVDLLSESIEPHFYEVRVIGSFYNEMDFRLFPFEELKLSIEIEPNSPLDINQLQLRMDPETGIDDVAKVPGWLVGEYSVSSEEHDYGNDEIYSRVTMDIIVERSLVGSTVKNLFPIMMITGLSLIIFWIPENYTPRIYLTAPLLLSLVYLHQGALDEIPPVGYMTIFDKIMIVNYTLFLNGIVSLAIQMRFHVKYNDHLKIEKVNKIMRYFIPIIVFGGLAILLPI